jgi:uncharacterized RDD family membrane protein YckC
MELRPPYTLEYQRARYARASSEELCELLQADPTHLTPEARQALTEEAARRGLDPRVAPVSTAVEPVRPREFIYPKAPLGERFVAYIVDSIIGVGPAITAAMYDFFFHITQSPTNRTINMIATVTWAIYYGATKDARGSGQSIGKKMAGLMVVGTSTNEPCTLGQSTTRAFVRFLFGAIPVVGQLVEPIAVLATNDGRRIGDRAASTQVIRASEYESAAPGRP